MSNFTADFDKKCQISRKFYGRLFVVLWTPKTIYMHWYIRHLRYLKAINVKMSPMVILLFIDMLTAYQVVHSHVQLHVASANYKLLMATVQTYRPTGIELSPIGPLPYKTSTKTVASPKPATVMGLLQLRYLVQSTCFKKALKVSKKVKVAYTRLPSVGFQSWSRFLAVSPQVTWSESRHRPEAVGCHYFLPSLRSPP